MTLRLQVRHQGKTHILEYQRQASQVVMAQLQEDITACTDVPVENQRLSYRGRPAGSLDPAASLADVGIGGGGPLLLFGSTAEAIAQMRRQDAAAERRLRARDAARTRAGASFDPRDSSRVEYSFGHIEPLAHYANVAGAPSPAEAAGLLSRLATDPGIVGIMQRHRWSVGLLTELAPGEGTGHVDEGGALLLGLNTNKGQKIHLRLRTGKGATAALR